MLDLTIAIPVKNEEKNLLFCLQSIGKDLAAHVVIIDSGSTDQTQKIANVWGADIINFKWNGKFPKKRNWFLRNYTITTKWVLFLDADEHLTQGFKEEMQKVLLNSNKVGYWLNYTIYFLGKQLRGGYPLRKLALFQVGAGEYERIDEQQWSQLDMEVHEHPILTGEVGTITSKIDHQDFRGISHYTTKHNEYAEWEVSRFLKDTNNASLKQWTWKQQLKYQLMRSVFIGPIYFCGSFFLWRGFRDGSRGLAFAILKMSYFTQIYCKIQEKQKLMSNQN